MVHIRLILRVWRNPRMVRGSVKRKTQNERHEERGVAAPNPRNPGKHEGMGRRNRQPAGEDRRRARGAGAHGKRKREHSPHTPYYKRKRSPSLPRYPARTREESDLTCGGMVVPTLDEVKAFAAANGIAADMAEDFHNYCDAMGWRHNGGVIYSWRAMLKAWPPRTASSSASRTGRPSRSRSSRRRDARSGAARSPLRGRVSPPAGGRVSPNGGVDFPQRGV